MSGRGRSRLRSGEWGGTVFQTNETPVAELFAFHGFSGSGLDFEMIADYFSIPFRMVAPDLPGHGETCFPSGGSVASMGDCSLGLAGLAEEYFSRSPVVIGYSMGARVALQYALHPCSGISGLVLIGGTAGISDDTQRQNRMEADEELAAWIAEHGIAAFCRRWMDLPIIASQSSIISPYRELLTQRKMTNSAKGLQDSLLGMGAGVMEPLWKRLPEIRVPTLVVVGENDMKYRSLGKQLVQELPYACLRVIPNAGHCAHLENPNGFTKYFQEFLLEL